MKTYLPPIWDMSGVRGFFGEGYAFHRIYKRLFGRLFTFDGVMFVAKTTTLLPNKGNMPMKEDGITPTELKPTCIAIGPWQFILGIMMNAVGLSGPGVVALLDKNRWQEMAESFMISFMSIAKGRDDETTAKLHLEEFETFVSSLKARLSQFAAKFLIQINISCMNVDHGSDAEAVVLKEVFGYMDLVARYLPGVRCIIKVNTLMQPETAVTFSRHPQCAGVCVSNALPWSALTRSERWWYFPLSIFTGKSPLARFGGGAFSGGPLLAEVERWIRDARRAGFNKHINAGGGIRCRNDVNRLVYAGADSISIGSVALLRPWRLRSIIAWVYHVLGPECVL
jgi:dihydroorotate dehydrogenase